MIGTTVCVAAVAALGGQARAATDGPFRDVYWVNQCSYFGNTAPVFGTALTGVGFSVADDCIGGHPPALQINALSAPKGGSLAQWTASTPSSSIRIIKVWTPNSSSGGGNPQADCALHTDGYYAEFFWGGNGTNYGTKQITIDCHGVYSGTEPVTGVNQYIQPSRYFGWQVACMISGGRCSIKHSKEILDLTGVALEVQETSGPRLDAVGQNLWYQTRWVRGAWSADLAASDPSGVCSMRTTVNGTPLGSYDDLGRASAQWTQCAGSQIDSTVDTTEYRNGAHTLSLAYSAANAAGAVSSVSKTFNVDNAPVSLRLSGPREALSSAGTQYVSATATAGPSGVAGIACSVDGAPVSWSGGSTRQLAVSGIGSHILRCYAQNNAVDPSGAAARSRPMIWRLSIRQPSLISLGFKSLAPHCHASHRRAIRCHPPAPGGRASSRVVAFGASTTVHGWLGTARGTPLRGRKVLILAAPANGSHRFRPIARATTTTDGSWSGRLPAGPSRLIKAFYPGSRLIAPASSRMATITVPASITLQIAPRTAHWGGTISLSGEVRGGYVPAKGELVVLSVGWAGGSTEIGHVYARGRGRFHGRYTFHRGSGTKHYQIWAATTAESDYPYARARSPKVAIAVRP